MEDLQENTNNRNFKEHNFSILNDSTPVGIIETDVDGNIIYYNAYFAKLVGYNNDELINTNIQNLFSRGGKMFFITSHLPVLKLNKEANEINYDLINKYGKRISVLINSVQFHRAEIDQSFLQFVIVNFPKRKKYENDLIEAKRKAEKSALIKSKFVATISHELRTPIHTILNSIDFLKENIKNEKQLEIIETLHFSTNNMLNIINSVLHLSKKEAGYKVQDTKNIELKKILALYKKLFQLTAETNNTKIEIIYDESIPSTLLGDLTKLNQVLTNLVGNALKFTKDGKVIISASLISKANDKCIVKFDITDTGIGIREENLKNIFIPFSQANNAISSKYGGTGLGLSISQNLLVEEGSKLQVKSEYGKGSSFFFEVEYMIAQIKQNKMEETFSKKLENIRVLVVDDNISNLSIASRYLKKWNITYDLVENGENAIEAAKTNQYHIIFMDINMPGMDGYETSVKIRENCLINDFLRIIVSSANYQDKEDSEIQAAGINGFLLKPYTAVQLYDKLLSNFKNLSLTNPDNFSTEYIDNLFEDDEEEKKSYYKALLKDNLQDVSILKELIENPVEERLRFVKHNLITDIKIFKIDGLTEKLETLKSLIQQEEKNKEFSDLLLDVYKTVLRFTEWLKFKTL